MKNSKKKSIIDTYTTIYFVDIVVANKYTTLEELKELYTYSDGTELDDQVLGGNACTATCIRKSDNCSVCLIKYNNDTKRKNINKQLDLINTVCHEAGHVVLDIYESIGQNVCNCSPEPFCYLLGYVSECIYKTLKK
jgi:hypothetical protein